MKYLVILLVVVGFISIANAQYAGNVEFYHKSVNTGFDQHSVLMQSESTKFTKAMFDQPAEALIFSISTSSDVIDTATITMNKQTMSQLFSGLEDDPSNMVLLINGEVKPYKIIVDHKMVSWMFYVPTESTQVELIPPTSMFGPVKSSEDIPFNVLRTYPPVKQNHIGVSYEDIKCKENLVLLQKYDGSPACVTESTKMKLIERGWTGITPTTKESMLERYDDLPEVTAFYETYPDAKVSVRNDHVSYFSGSDDGYFVRMNLMFDENHSITDVDFHCYFQRVHQYELPQNDIAPKIVNSDCKEHGKTVHTGLTFEQRCVDNFKLLRAKIHDLQTSQYASATSYVTELDKALDIKKELYELQCQSRAIEWFHLISGNELSNPTQMQIQRTNGNVGEITNHMLLSPQNAVKMKIAAELEQRKIDYTIIPVTGSHTDEGWLDPARLCSTLSFDNGTKFYASSVFHPEPLEIIGIFVDLERPDDCQKYSDLPT